MLTPVFLAKVEKNRLRMEKPQEFGIWCSQFEGKEVDVTVKQKKRPRTSGGYNELSNQNGLYWIYLGLIEKETGNNANEMHEYFKRKFLKPKNLTMFKENIKIPGSTTDLDKFEFSEYMNKIEILTGILIPDKYEI